MSKGYSLEQKENHVIIEVSDPDIANALKNGIYSDSKQWERNEITRELGMEIAQLKKQTQIFYKIGDNYKRI